MDKTHFKLISLLVVALMFGACSSGEKLARDGSQIEAYEDGMYLSDAGEDGIVELIIPEVVEYTEVKEQVQEQANLEAMDLGAREPDLQVEKEIEQSVASIGLAEPVPFEILEQERKEELLALNDVQEMNIQPTENDFTEAAILAASVVDTVSNERSITFVDASKDSDEFEFYEVQKNDSLMLISFKLYNTFDRWKDLAEWNELDGNSEFLVKAGQKLKVQLINNESNSWQPEGNPYLIKVGDYLGKISSERYDGKSKYWFDIWKNNEVLIKNPDVLFVGFTIYTRDLDVVIVAEAERKATKTRGLAGSVSQ